MYTASVNATAEVNHEFESQFGLESEEADLTAW
jgi:hypothetical protein